MARSLWTGSLSFGLVNVPVALYSGVRDHSLHFRQLHEKDGAPIEVRRFCSQDDEEVRFEDVGHGYDLDGKQVVLSDEELATAQPRRTRTIDIEAFVDLDEVDPIYFDHPYVLAPSGEAEGIQRAYRLLVEVMSRTDRAALGRIVLRTKEYLVLLRARDEQLVLTTMLFHDELRPTKDIPAGSKKPTKQQLDQAVALIEALSEDWDPSRYEDRYRKRLQDVLARKKRGRKITAPEQQKEPKPVPDLMAALEKTLADLNGGGNGSGSDAEDLSSLSKDELMERAQEQDVPGRSSMSKKELIEALQD
jgi:DNA end-binding protein Ku